MAGSEEGDADGVDAHLQQAAGLAGDAAGLVVHHRRLEAGPAAGLGGGGVGRVGVDLDLAVDHPQGEDLEGLLADQGGAVAQIELEVVPAAGEHIARHAPGDQGVALVGAGGGAGAGP
jgi:hypothetical protein